MRKLMESQQNKGDNDEEADLTEFKDTALARLCCIPFSEIEANTLKELRMKSRELRTTLAGENLSQFEDFEDGCSLVPGLFLAACDLACVGTSGSRTSRSSS